VKPFSVGDNFPDCHRLQPMVFKGFVSLHALPLPNSDAVPRTFTALLVPLCLHGEASTHHSPPLRRFLAGHQNQSVQPSPRYFYTRLVPRNRPSSRVSSYLASSCSFVLILVQLSSLESSSLVRATKFCLAPCC
jgi:hypothetical protein